MDTSIELTNNRTDHSGKKEIPTISMTFTRFRAKNLFPDHLSHSFLRLLKGIKRSEPEVSEELFHQKSRLQTIFYHGATLRRNHAACSGRGMELSSQKIEQNTGRRDTLDFTVANAFSSKSLFPDHLSHSFLRLLRGIKRSEPEISEELFFTQKPIPNNFYHDSTLRRNHTG